MDNSKSVNPRIIIHGGAGNFKRSKLPLDKYVEYRAALLTILNESSSLLYAGHSSLDVATYAVSLLEDTPLFNCGKGAVFTRDGKNELEASVMVSRGYRKRGVAVSLLKHVKNPIKLAKEMLVRGETDRGGVGAQGHCHISGPKAEELAKEWGMEMCDEKYFWTEKRWQEHKIGLEREKNGHFFLTDYDNYSLHEVEDDRVGGDPGWSSNEYLPQGTVGCVVLDRDGTICTATSTGGITNKLPGRIGDTPTLGAGFWAEEWDVPQYFSSPRSFAASLWSSRGGSLARQLQDTIGCCLPRVGKYPYSRLSARSEICRGAEGIEEKRSAIGTSRRSVRAVGLSGTGNGDSFLRLAAVRTAAMIPRLVPSASLAGAVTDIAGPGGELQKSAGDRWGVTGEGEGGMIGIEYVNGVGKVVADFNCGGMFRAWIDEKRKAKVLLFQDELGF